MERKLLLCFMSGQVKISCDRMTGFAYPYRFKSFPKHAAKTNELLTRVQRDKDCFPRSQCTSKSKVLHNKAAATLGLQQIFQMLHSSPTMHRIFASIPAYTITSSFWLPLAIYLCPQMDRTSLQGIGGPLHRPPVNGSPNLGRQTATFVVFRASVDLT